MGEREVFGDRWLLAIVGVGVAIRVALVLRDPSTLAIDTDAYLSLASGLAETGQFGIDRPTAFRPPLYPLLLTPIEWLEPSETVANLLRGLLNVAFAAGTIATTLACGRLLDDTRGALVGGVAAALVAVSPLGVQYSRFAMTETLCGLLVTVAVWLSLRWIRIDAISRRDAVALGVALGLGALCRPTVWPFAAIVLTVLTMRFARRREALTRVPLVAAALSAVVLPWVVRNALSVGKSTPLTTHGGYTLALGNNDAFYREIVHAPWGTVWTDGQVRWIEAELSQARGVGMDGELELDAYFRDRAVDAIRSSPGDFAAACWLRLRRFWSPAPVTVSLTSPLGLSLLAFGLTVAGLASFGVVRCWRRDWVRIAIVLAGPVAFTAVHLIYWSNARMRLPIEPCAFLLAGCGVATLLDAVRSRWSEGMTGDR